VIAPMRLATFNANSVRSRLPVICAWLKAHAPDILAVQETKVEDQEFPAAAFRAAGYHAVFRGEKSYNGVALLSRLKPSRVRFGLDDGGPADEARLLQARVGPIQIVNTYVPQGRDIADAMFQYKLAWFARLRAYFERHFTQRALVVWVGDLNVAPQAIDIHNAAEQAQHVCYHPAVRQAFSHTVAWGFVDVFRQHHPEAGQYTYFDYRTPNAVLRQMGWRVDHILATPALAAKCRDAYIDLQPRRAAKPSDHTFVVAEFDLG
jgi:exodeoxyribonuclease III